MMGYIFSLGLSFLIGASILKTMISSQWNDIAQLVVIILSRTVLNLLLERANRIGQKEITFDVNFLFEDLTIEKKNCIQSLIG